MKSYVTAAAHCDYEDEWEIEELNHKYNAVICDVDPVKSDVGIEKGFFTLCGLMEEYGSNSPQNYSVIQFYSKLNYINEKIQKENELNSGRQ